MNMRPNNHRALLSGYLEDSKKSPKKIPAWKRSEMELREMERRIGVDVDPESEVEPRMIWKVHPDSYTEADRQILADRAAKDKAKAEAEAAKLNVAEDELAESEKKIAAAAEQLSYYWYPHRGEY